MSFTDLEHHDAFCQRHLGPRDSDLAAMLATVLPAADSPTLDTLVEAIVPDSIRLKGALDLAAPLTEEEALAKLERVAARNLQFRSHIGCGYHGTFTPKVILRNILENPAWYTAYTPYQAEISQGRMEALVNFQTMVCDLTGMEIGNASLLDEATAAAEAMTLAKRSAKSKSHRFVASADCHPQTLAVLATRAEALGIELAVLSDAELLAEASAAASPADAASPIGGAAVTTPGAFGYLVQYPGSTGAIRDWRALADAAHAAGAVLAVSADLLACTVIAPPGEWGADIVVGSSQRFGVPMGYGGPHAAFLACRDAYKRSMPGRLVGVSIDARGKPAYRLTLQTREQHIRREKATSNICTAQVLLAVMASMYAVWHGPEGLRRIALRVHRLAAALAGELRTAGFTVPQEFFFDTITVTDIDAERIHASARANRINLRHIDAATVGISLDETTTAADVRALLALFGVTLRDDEVRADADRLEARSAAAGQGASVGMAGATAGAASAGASALTAVPAFEHALPPALIRASGYLAHPVFNTHRSETAMLRYLRRLADQDLALDRSMIPLGSCTMKLNATAEMIPVTWPGFAQLHPHVPHEQALGYAQLIDELEKMLCACTGYDAVSFQPNSGAQGEYAGLLAIRAYHRARGEGHRHICLIPESAHGTNPASAQMCGMEVVVVKCDANGNVDVADLRAKAEKHSATLAALMVTYPSTHGVFEEAIVEICDVVHAHGGQVYTDGANMNALVGLAAPGRFGSDVSHLNLHKTFCIPHGGGGPGVGPVAVKAHLAPFLPGHLPHGDDTLADGKVGHMVSAADHGSASILPISWMYIAMMGASGLRRATEVALLNANYIAAKLAPHYPVLYSGRNGLVAHECILDLRPLKDATGVGAEDVAKRLIDYGFHAPTLSFPVAGTLMVEPTESESKEELDRFIAAMVAIRDEIRAVEEGRLDREDNPLRHAPHTADQVSASDWPHAYSRELAAYPLGSLKAPGAKYWPPVARVDNVWGDRNIMCSCPPVSDYEG
ncbi:aminomethyl-transferring glycine dehydrogenase subunit GcvPB [Derxia gummosa]|uniref:Glycine dehydrogenase (decarboxylating) n=1 Tax=Derxia gummosa DSM 723 TaxID=1121388 RepID=A0A8B6X1A0_9BURK|nr:aminomethyl-transferring glycine dehydrogenase subunit GcvPB [Derxia gummosa]